MIICISVYQYIAYVARMYHEILQGGVICRRSWELVQGSACLQGHRPAARWTVDPQTPANGRPERDAYGDLGRIGHQNPWWIKGQSASIRITTKYVASCSFSSPDCHISSWATAQLTLTVLDWIALHFSNALNFLHRLASRPWSAMMRSSLPRFRVQRRWRSYAWWNLHILQFGLWHLRMSLYFATALFAFSSQRVQSVPHYTSLHYLRLSDHYNSLFNVQVYHSISI